VVDFAETAMRRMCRNPRCGSKLPEPVSNPRAAFMVPSRRIALLY